MTAIAVVDAWLAILPLGADMLPDDTAAEPAKVNPNRLYLWPRRTAPQRLEEANGRFIEADLRLRILYALPAKGEVRAVSRDRELSEALDAAVDAIHVAVAGNRRSGSLWWDAWIEQTTYDAIRTDVVRAVAVDLVVRLNLDEPRVFGGSGEERGESGIR